MENRPVPPQFIVDLDPSHPASGLLLIGLAVLLFFSRAWQQRQTDRLNALVARIAPDMTRLGRWPRSQNSDGKPAPYLIVWCAALTVGGLAIIIYASG